MDLEEEIEEILKMNKEQRNMIIKEYLLLYCKSLFLDGKGKQKRKILEDKLKEYIKIIRCENNYLSFIKKNISKIRNLEDVIDLMDELDELNEKTYLYYIGIVEEYEEQIECGLLDRKIGIKRNYCTLMERQDIKEKVLSISKNSKI